MKKMSLLIIAVILSACAVIRADILMSNEVTLGANNYFAYYGGLGTKDRTNFTWDFNAGFAKSGKSDITFDAGLTLGFKIAPPTRISAGYVYGRSLSYYIEDISFGWASLSYPIIYNSHTAALEISQEAGPFEISPSIAAEFGNINGNFEIKMKGVINEASTYSIMSQTTDSRFVIWKPGCTVYAYLPEDYTLSVGGEKPVYSEDIKTVLDSTGTSLASRQAIDVKSAVTFTDYQLNAGISKSLETLYLSLKYRYGRHLFASSEVAIESSHDIVFRLMNDFTPKFTMGIVYENSNGSYTDGSMSSGNYFTLLAEFDL